MHRIKCSEVWGGIRDTDVDACTSCLTASLFSGACRGGKGGDIYYFSVCARGLITRLAVADVIGHGPEVSAVSQWMYESLVARMNCLENDEVLADLNRLAGEYGLGAMTTVAVVALFHKASSLSFAYAGHLPVLVRRRGDRAWRRLELRPHQGVANLLLGVSSDAIYEQHEIPFAAGDRLFLYTDGVVEAFDHDGHQFGQERLLEILNEHTARSLPELKSAVLSALRRHTGGPLVHDDVTLLAAEAV